MPFVIGAILLFGIVGVVLVRVAADGKTPSVLLKWNPPAPKPGVTVAGYNVYRIELDGSEQLIAEGVKESSYVDHNVRNGVSYRYFVRAVNPDGYQGPPSNLAPAPIP